MTQPAKKKQAPKPKHGPKAQMKRPKQRFPWEKWRAEFVASDPERVPALIDFFKPMGISPNTWRRRTSAWHRERMAYRAKVAQDALLRFRRSAADVLVQQVKMGQIVSTLAFNDLVVKDPATKDTYLAHRVRVVDAKGVVSYRLEPLKASEAIRLYGEGTRNANRAFGLDKVIHKDAIPGEFQQPPIETTAGAAPTLPDTDDEKDLKDLRSILKDPEGLKHAIALLKAVEQRKDGRK